MAIHEIEVGERAIYAVDFEAPRSDIAGYIRCFQTEVMDRRDDSVTNRDIGRLRFAFRGNRGDREFLVLRESYDQESETWVSPDRVYSTRDATEAVKFMGGAEAAGKLAVSVFFEPNDPQYGFPAIH